MLTYVFPYDCMVEKNAHGESPALARLDRALEIAQSIPDSIIILAANMRTHCKARFGVESYAELRAQYLERKGWPRSRMVIYPIAYETVAETMAALETVKERGGGSVIAVTSRYHAIRVWSIWRFGFKRKATVAVSMDKASLLDYIKDLIFTPFSVISAIAIRSRL